MTAHDTTLRDGDSSFEVQVVEGEAPSRTVLFALGRGGRPEQYRPLFERLAERGCRVVAPRVEPVRSTPTAADMLARLRPLAVAADALALAGKPLTGLGHSLGAAMLLTLAGGTPWTRQDGPLSWERTLAFQRLALITPATDFFGAPGALDAVHVPVLAFAGEADTRTPPEKVAMLRTAIGERVELRVAENAGHFTFMNTLPPDMDDPHPDREAFLAEFAREVGDFLVG